MQITTIPFVHHSSIKQANDQLYITPSKLLENHLSTLHAGALYTLAEAQSGLTLQTLFPAYADTTLPLLRESSIKYKKPATTSVWAKAHCEDDAIVAFKEQLEKRSRGVITLDVTLTSEHKEIVAIASFTWFVQKKPVV